VLRAVARKGGATISDEISFIYQTEKWDKPATLKLAEVSRSNGKVLVEAKMLDAKGVQCLDARNRVRFSVAGDGELSDNLRTSTGSRVMEMYNGRAEISLCLKGVADVGITSDGLAFRFPCSNVSFSEMNDEQLK